MASSRTMPQPLSVIWMSFFPPASTLILMRVAAASREFSNISLTTDAGRSTTSPAAIWLATVSERTWILPMCEVSGQWTVASGQCRRRDGKNKDAADLSATLRTPTVVIPSGARNLLFTGGGKQQVPLTSLLGMTTQAGVLLFEPHC